MTFLKSLIILDVSVFPEFCSRRVDAVLVCDTEPTVETGGAKAGVALVIHRTSTYE